MNNITGLTTKITFLPMTIVLLWGGLSKAYATSINELGDENCDNLLLVSSYFQNNVKIFDGCSGHYIRELDQQNKIMGAQAIKQLPNGSLLVASEGNNRLITFDLKDIENSTIVADSSTENFIGTPLGLTFNDNDELLVASYGENKVVSLNPESWQVTNTVFDTSQASISGIDAGIIIDGSDLYLPGYDSDNVVKLNLITQTAEELVPSKSSGLNAPRGLLIKGNELFVTSELTNQILVFNKDSGEFIRQTSTNHRPAGIAADGNDHFIYNTGTSVYRVTYDFAESEKIVTATEQQLSSATYVYRLKKNIDSDGDGLSDSDELDNGTEVLNPDSDGDTMPDGYEVEYELNPLINDSDLDLDNDNVSNITEYYQGSYPNHSDSDEDGITDDEDELVMIPSSDVAVFGDPSDKVFQDQDYHFVPELIYQGNQSHITYLISEKPTWANFSAATGELSGVPNNADVGIFENISVQATNGHSVSETITFSIEVVNVNDSPQHSSTFSTNLGEVLVGSQINIDLSQLYDEIDQDDELSFTSSDLDAALSISADGKLTGTVNTVSNMSFTLFVSDNFGGQISDTLTLTAIEEDKDKNSSGGSIFYLLLGSLLAFKRSKLKL